MPLDVFLKCPLHDGSEYSVDVSGRTATGSVLYNSLRAVLKSIFVIGVFSWRESDTRIKKGRSKA